MKVPAYKYSGFHELPAEWSIIYPLNLYRSNILKENIRPYDGNRTRASHIAVGALTIYKNSINTTYMKCLIMASLSYSF